MSLALGGQGGKATALIDTDTSAHIGRAPVAGVTTLVTATGTVSVTADALPSATASAKSGGGSLAITVQAFDAEATIKGRVAAAIGNATVKSDVLDVIAEVTTAAPATATIQIDGGAAGVNVGAGKATTTMEFNADARLGPNATIDATGQIQVHAKLTGTAITTSGNGGGAAITVNSLGAKATAQGATNAVVDTGTTVLRGRPGSTSSPTRRRPRARPSTSPPAGV